MKGRMLCLHCKFSQNTTDMKTFRTTIMALAISTGLFVGAFGSVPYVKVTSYDAKKFFVIVKGVEAAPVQISLKDTQDFELFNETYKRGDDYLKGFDLESLPDGEYFLEIENSQNLQVFTLSIINDKLFIHHDNPVAIARPTIIQRGNKVDVAVLKTGTPLKLSILNMANDIIFQDKVTSSGNLNKRYDMSQLDPGNYTLRIDVDGRSFRQHIYIQ